MEAVMNVVEAWPITSAVLLLIGLNYVYTTIKYRNAPPIVSSGIPIIGPFLGFAKNPVSFVRKMHDKYGPVFTLNMFAKRLTFVLGPGVHDVFYDLNDDQMNQASVYKFMTPVFGKGVVYDAPLKIRMQQIRFVAGSLRTSQLRTYVPKLVEETNMFLKKFPKEGTMSVIEKMSELIILTASRCLMGREIRETLFEEVATLYADLDKGITPLSLFFPNAPTAAHKKRNEARVEMSRLFGKVIANRRAQSKKAREAGREPEVHDDVLQVLMDAQYKATKTEPARSLTSDEVAGLMIALLFGGQHTSSITTTWSILLILSRPDIHKRVLEEQATLRGADFSKPLDYDTIKEMVLLKNCVKEALRMYPPLIFLMREVECHLPLAVPKSLEHGGKSYTLPKGDYVFSSPAVAMRLPTVFSNPDKFDPDRYAPPREEDSTKYSFIGFGGGLHGCIGQNFGYMQVMTIVAQMLTRYELVPEEKIVPKPNYSAMVVGPSGETRVHFKTRAGVAI